jgi:ATP-dependent Zn protease
MRVDLVEAGRRSVELVERFGLGEGLDGFSLGGLHKGRWNVQEVNAQNLSEETLEESDGAAKKLYQEQRKVAEDILKEFGKERLEWLARQLVDRVTILEAELDELIEKAEKKFKKTE